MAVLSPNAAAGEANVLESEDVSSLPPIYFGDPQETMIEEIERLRGEHGMAGDLDAALAARGVTRDSTDDELAAVRNESGFIGTPAEDAEMRLRDAISEGIELGLQDQGLADKQISWYRDNARGGQHVIQTAGPAPQSLRDAVAAIVEKAGGMPGDVRFEEVKYTAAELDEVIRRAVDRVPLKQGVVPDVVEVGVDTIGNGLFVTLRPGADETAALRLLDLGDVPIKLREGTLTLDACTSRQMCGSPRRAGVMIVDDGASAACTTGYLTLVNGNPSGLTAGHCWAGDDSSHLYAGNGEYYGRLSNHNTLKRTHVQADWRRVVLPGGAPRIFRDPTHHYQAVEDGPLLGGVGVKACLFGMRAEHPRCGTITTTSSTPLYYTPCACFVHNLVGATYTSSDGDSGGAVAASKNGRAARGIHSSRVAGEARYSNLHYLSTHGPGSPGQLYLLP